MITMVTIVILNMDTTAELKGTGILVIINISYVHFSRMELIVCRKMCSLYYICVVEIIDVIFQKLLKGCQNRSLFITK